MIVEHISKGERCAAYFTHVSLLILEVLVESVTFKAGVSPETGAADFAIQRRLGIVNSRDVIPQFAVSSGTKGTGVGETVFRRHVKERVAEFDLLCANATRQQRRRL